MLEQPKKYFLPSTLEVTEPAFDARLKMILKSLGISDRDMPTLIQDLILKIDMRGGVIWRPAEFVEPVLIDDVWGNPRFLREFMSAPPGANPEKVKWLAFYVMIEHSRLYRHLIR